MGLNTQKHPILVVFLDQISQFRKFLNKNTHKKSPLQKV